MSGADPGGEGGLVIRGRRLPLGQRTLVMGILNVTPDSFSGDGLARTGGPDVVEAAVGRAVRMAREGADIIDVGGESTRPGHRPVGIEDELGRVVDVIAAIRRALPAIAISVDTSKPAVASAALEAGAGMLNDVAAVTHGAALAPVAARHGVPYVVMHAFAAPTAGDVVVEVIDGLRGALAAAEAAGCDPASLVVDPGIGFGTTAEQNLELLRRLADLRGLGRPILLGASRKSTIGRVLGLPADDRLEGTLATTALGVAAGVDIVRVHDVAANVRVARMADAIVRGGWHDADAGSTPGPA